MENFMRDPLKQTEAIRNEVFKSLEEKHSNIQTKNRTLKLSNFRSDDLPDPDDYARQREILNLGKTEGVNIYGKVELIDNKTGKVIDSKDKMKLGFIPTTTNRHSFIVNGKEYIVHNQMRLKSGVFTRIDRLGNPVADFNLAKGSNMSMQYKPEAQYTEIQTGNAKIPLYTILKDVYEIPDKKLSNVFGSDVHKQESQAINSKNRDKYLHKLHDAVTFKKSTDFTPKEIKENLKTYFDNTVMDPQNNKNTIGIPSSKIDPKILAKTAKDVLEIYKGKKDPTWKDNIAFKEVNAVEDFIRERLTKTKRINEMHMKVKPKIDRAETVYDTGVGKLINANINKFFKDSDLVNYPLQVNPMEFLENAHKITSLGEGGVTSTNSLPVDARNLHLSQLGFIDPVRTPDNINAGVDLRMGLFASKQDKSLVIPVVDKKGKIVKIKHDDLFNHIYIVKTEPPQSNGKYRAMYKGKMVEVSKDKIEYFLHPDSLFTVSTATIPFKKNTQGQRNAMGAKMTTQALSLVNRELPIVDTKAAQIAAKYYTPKSPVDGIVKKVTKDFIIILGNDKIEHKVNIPNKFALNYHSYLHVDPSIKEGMKVKKGDILGDNNFSVSGEEEVFIKQNNETSKVKLKNLVYSNDIKVLALDCDALKYSWKPLKEYIKHRTEDPLVKITTQSGRTMTVTASHSCLTVDDDGAIVKIRPSEMIEGKTLVPLAGNIPENTEHTIWDISQYLPKTRYQINGSTYTIDNISISTSLGFLLGLYIAEGYTSVGKYVIWSAMNEEIRQKTIECLKDIGVTNARLNKTTISVGCAHLARTFTNELGTGSSNKRIPHWIFSAPKEVKEAFIDGFWSGDGSVGECIGAQINAKDAAYEIQTLLASLHIHSSVRIHIRDYPQFKNAVKTHYRIYVANGSVDKFPPLTHKIKELNRTKLHKSTKDKTALAPLPDKLVTGSLRCHIKKGYIGLTTAKTKITNIKHRKLIDNEVLWDLVKTIEYVEPEEFVYDLSVGDHETFVLASGLTVHNTKEGKLALGINAKVAFMPYRGLNFEDGFVVTRQGADKFTSSHIFQETIDLTDPTIDMDIKKHRSYFPQKYTVDQLSKLENGIVKKGTKVYSGDPLIISLKKRNQSPEILRQGLMASRITNPFKDVSIDWTKDYPGTVTEIIHTPKMIKVVIEATAPLVEGDKICVDALTEVFTKRGWKYINQVDIHDKVLMLKDGVEVEWDEPQAIHIYQGPHNMLRRVNRDLDMFVTLDHYELALTGGQVSRIQAKDLIGKEWSSLSYKKGAINIQKHDTNNTEEVIIKYDQPVYCLTTKHSNFYIRRRGKERFTGNCSRYGSKGIVVKIIDNHEAPKYKNGEIPDVLINPAAVPSRMNVGQIFEAQMAKALQKAGKRVEYDDLNDRDTFKEVKAIMKKYKTKDTDTLYDPVSKKNIKDVFNGTQYFLKLAKQTETNFAARAGGDYDIDQRPVKGGEEGAKSVGTLDMYAFLSHNARAILKEKSTQTSQYNPEFWAAVLSGQPLPPSQPTFTFNKTLEMLRGAGINVQKKGNILHSLPFTDKDIKKISSGEIKSGKMVSNKPDPVTGLQFRPEKGGLFDPVKTGGLIGSDYSHIKLHEPVIHKWFEAPIKTLLGLNTKELAAIQYRDKTVTVNGKQKTGVEAIRQLLKEIDVEKELKALRIKIKREDLKLEQKDQIIKKIQYLKALKEYKMTPDKAYVNELIPIIPPKYRPIYPKETGEVVTSDANHLYREIAEVNASLNSPLMKALGQDSQEYKNKLKELHVSIGKMQGVEKSENPDLREPSGFIEIIKGKGQPKYGYFQHKVMSKVQDIVGRGTIAPDPKLGLDECSIPEDMAWKIYSPFITGEMVKRGYEYDKAVEEIEKRTQTARNALIAEMNRRPVILNRAPSLHKFSMMAFKPKLNNTKTIYICPLVVKPFNADFDGDSCIGGVFSRFINSTDNLDNQKNSYYNEDMFYYSSNERSSNMLSQKQNIRYTHGLINLEKFPRLEETKVVTGNKEEYQVPEGVEVLTVWNGERKWIKPDSFSIHNNVAIIQVKTNTGRTVKVTNDHSLVSLDKNLSYVDAQAKIGLCMPRIIEPVTTGNLDHIEIELDQTGLTNKMKEKVPANFNLGFYIGAVIADGWVDSANNVIVAKTCPELARYIKEECLPNIFGHEIGVNIQHNPHKFSKEIDIDCLSTKIISSSKALSLYMTQWVGKGAANKHLPEFWAEGKEDFRWGLLSGLINGDGTVTEVKAKSKPKPQTQIHYDTLSRFLAHEVVALGSSLGLICTMTQYSSSSTGNTMYAVHFSQESIGKMRDRLFLTVKNKKDVLSRFEMSDTATRNKFTPTLPLNRVQELRTYFKHKDVNSGIWKSTKTEEETVAQRAINAIYIELGKTKNDRAFNKEWSKKVVSYDLPIFKNDPFWIKWKELVLDDSIEWEIIESIEPVPSESVAYDLTIPPAYTMVNDWGLILFDTMVCHVVASEEAIQEADGMRPSKNLFSPRNNSVNYKPDQEAIMGLYLGSKGNDNKEKKTMKTFKTIKEAKQAYDDGLIDADDRIKVAELI
jgi:DNA-directed RNA polymerase beta subunit/intein/homing endonuclease